MANNNMGEAFDWDVEELSDEGGFTLVPAGTYAFEVTRIEKEKFEGSDKTAPCPRAKITLNVLTESGWATVFDRINLNTKSAWRIAKFFSGLGYQKNPETGKVPIKWSEAEGKQGWLKLKIRKYKSNGEDRETNDVDAYLNPSEWPQSAPAPAQAPVAQPVVMQQPVIQQLPLPMQMPAQPAPATQHPGSYIAGSF